MAENYRSLFDFNPEIIYLNHASTGMLPRRAVEAMTEYIEALASAGEPRMETLLELQADFRTEAARLLNVHPKDIAFVRNTTNGLAIALHSIDWQDGENMVVQEDAFPASLYLAAYCFPHVEKRYVPLSNGADFYDRLQQQIDDRTRAIVVDYVHFLSGYRLDLQRLSQLKRQEKCYLIVDGIQGLGALQVHLNSSPIDFFTAGGVKWLNGPSGTGILFVRHEILPDLIPFHISWAGAAYENLDSFYPVRPLYPDARRFQPVNDNFIGMIGLMESLRLIHEISPQVIEKNILNITERAITILKARGYHVITPLDATLRAGIVTFKHPKLDSQKLFEQLQANQVICSLREGYIRLAFHFYNTDEELNHVISILDSIAK